MNIGTVHAFLVDEALEPASDVEYADHLDKWSAECGRRIRILLPLSFDTEEPTDCSRCTEIALQGR